MSVSPTATCGWEAQYEKDFAAQTSSGPIVFTEDQRRKNKEVLRHVSDLLPFADIYKASDCDLVYRFLIGKHWNVNLTVKGLREYIDLRKKENLDGLIGEQLHPTIGAVLCPCYSNGVPCPIYGLDRDGLPILWLSPDAAKVIAAMKQFTDAQLLRGQMRVIELGRFVCRARGVDRCTYVIDLGGITMSSVNKATLGFLKCVMNMLQVAYPEIMRRLLIFNTGWAVSAAWKVLRPFVDVRVQDKIKFESKAPTLSALQPYMAADQVHPAFGGTGKENLLDSLIEAEVRRVRRAADGAAPATASFLDDSSLFDIDPQRLHSFYCPTPSPACPTPNESRANIALSAAAENGTTDRVIIGAPRAVSVWMANMEDEGEAKDALDMSLSAASSSGDYAVAKSTAEVDASRSRCLSSCNTAALAAEPSPSLGEPCRDEEHEEALPIVAVSLTYGADGSITGYCGEKCVGQFCNGRLFALSRDPNSDSASSHNTSPSVASPGFLPSRDTNCGNGPCIGRRSERKSAVSHLNPPIGELLYEAGHPIHNFYIVCDAQRNARYLLRRSRLRTRLSVYNVIGGAPVRTEKNSRHYVEGERVKLGVAVPSTDPASNSKGNWMLYGEDVVQRSPGQQLKNFFSKTRRNSAPAAVEGLGSNYVDKSKGGGSWAASMLAAMSAVTSPSKRKAKLVAGERGVGDVSSPSVTSPLNVVRKKSFTEADNNNSSGAQLLAESKGQTVYFYNLLTRSPLSDLFALAVAITLSWSGELESLKDKPSSKSRRYISDDEDLAT